jgi:hypothetical protein
MSHSHERTLLASLGFADPDRRDRRHTLACQYLSTPDAALRLLARYKPEMVEPRTTPEPVTLGKGERPPDLSAPRGAVLSQAQMEVPILRGRDFLVGFWDVALTFRGMSWAWEERDTVYAEPAAVAVVEKVAGMFGARWSTVTGSRGAVGVPSGAARSVAVGATWRPTAYETSQRLYVEVKTAPMDVADICKQLALYMQFTPAAGSLFVVATCYPMPKVDRETLAAKGVRHVWLGDGFEAWCKARPRDEGREEGL